MLPLRFRFAPGLLTLALALGCSSESATPQEGLGVEQQTIYGGAVDTEHQAVVYVLDEQGSACSGTVIARSGSRGVVLTAAHCVDLDYVILADDFDAVVNGVPDAGSLFSVTGFLPHPQFNVNQPEENDFALVRFEGATATTPVIPPLEPAEDTLANGVDLEFVGYGVTENGDNSLRRQVTLPISALTPTLITVSLTGGQGPCAGDSGGPALLEVNGAPKVAGVMAVGDPTCELGAASGRVSAVYTSFIQPGILELTQVTCDDCTAAATSGTGACAAELDACLADVECEAYASCATQCSDDTCRTGCASTHPAGKTQYDQVVACTCNECAQSCPACGGADAGTDGGATDSGSGGSESDAATGGGGSGGSGAGSGGKSGAASASDDDGGCGCRASSSSGAASGIVLLLGLFLAVNRRSARRSGSGTRHARSARRRPRE